MCLLSAVILTCLTRKSKARKKDDKTEASEVTSQGSVASVVIASAAAS